MILTPPRLGCLCCATWLTVATRAPERSALLQHHHRSQCQILGGLLRPDRNSNLANTSGARSADQNLRLAVRAVSNRCLVLRMFQRHGGQRLLPESVAQLRPCDTIRSRRCRQCTLCRSDTPFRDLRVGDIKKHRPTARFPITSLLRARSQCHQVTSFDDGPLPNCPIRDTILTEKDTQVVPELRRASAMALWRCIVSRYATAWAESLEGAISRHQTWALLCFASLAVGRGPQR